VALLLLCKGLHKTKGISVAVTPEELLEQYKLQLAEAHEQLAIARAQLQEQDEPQTYNQFSVEELVEGVSKS